MKIPMTPTRQSMTLIVAEAGGEWASWVEALRRRGDTVVVMRQRDDESLGALAGRVRARCREALSQGATMERAVIAGGGRADRDALSARSLAIRAIVSAMSPRRRGRLLLDPSGSDRYSMMALATTVTAMLRGTGVRVETADRHVQDAGLAA